MKSNRFLTLVVLITTVFMSKGILAQELTTIRAVQGTDNVSPLVDEIVTLEGIVTASFQDEESFSGFFIQSEVGENSGTGSSGLYIYERQAKVSIGDLIQLTGEVSETHDVTQITNVTALKVIKTNQVLPQLVAIKLPLNGLNLENLEGMRVTLKKPSLITDHYNYIKYGEIVVSSKLSMNPTNNVTPGSEVALKRKQNADDRLLIDDGSFSQFSNYKDIDNNTPIHIGAKVQVAGIMHYAFDKYRIEITEPFEFFDSPFAKQTQPTAISGTVKIASFNIRNYFTTLDNGKTMCGPLLDFDCRGADSKAEFMRQQAKLVSAINTAQADVFAIQELENHKDSLKTLVTALNKNTKKNTWHYIKTGAIGEDVIRVGLIYKTKTITPIGQHKLLNAKVNAEFEGDKNREVLLQTFKDTNNNLFNLAVLHLKSKRCDDSVATDMDQNDGQGCYNASRTTVAQQISDWLAQDPTNQKAQATIVTGDFNSYLKEDPISQFEKNGYINLANQFLTVENWTSIFRGEIGSIDHILINKSSINTAKDMTQWHINSIGTGWFDYNLENLTKDKKKPKSYYQPSPFSSSDHDIIMAGFDFFQD